MDDPDAESVLHSFERGTLTAQWSSGTRIRVAVVGKSSRSAPQLAAPTVPYPAPIVPYVLTPLSGARFSLCS